MKFQPVALIALTVLSLSLTAQAADPAPCSLSVGIVPRTGLIFRTWTNALETNVLEGQKGLKVCQDDDIPNQLPETTITCNSEFHLQMLFRTDQTMRNLSIFRAGKRIFTLDAPGYRMSQKIMKSIPTCEELEKLPVLKPTSK